MIENISRPNVVLVVLDTARADHFSLYGYDRPTTPNVDKLANKATVYERAISPSPWSVPSHASLFSGVLPSTHGTYIDDPHVDPAYVRLPRLLRDHGYRTIGVSSNTWITPEFGFDKGFDEFVSISELLQTDIDSRSVASSSLMSRLATYLQSGSLPRELVNLAYRKLYFKCYDYGAWRTNRVIERKIEPTDDPFFLFVNYMEPHLEYDPPKFVSEFVDDPPTDINQNAWEYILGVESMYEEEFETLRGLYDAELKYVDYKLGDILEYLRSIGEYEDSLILITSDHGENIGDHELMDHQYCLYNTLLHVPLVVKYPHQSEPDQVADPVSTLDLLPTVASQLNAETTWDCDGQRLQDRSDSEERYIVSEYLQPTPTPESMLENYPDADCKRLSELDRSIRAIQNETEKYVEYSDGTQAYFDFERDDPETTNRIDNASEERIEALSLMLADRAAPLSSAESENDVTIESKRKNMLEDLGYLI